MKKMKTNKDDIRALKSQHRLEAVMQEAGEAFEIGSVNSGRWKSITTPDLIVDIDRQIFEIKKPDLEIEKGDVLAWLKRRYAWSFGMAVRFLKSRPPDLKQETPLARVEIKPPVFSDAEDEIRPLDKWEEEALQIGGERMRAYFSWSWYELVMNTDETRIEPVQAPEIKICPRCKKRLDWVVEKTTYSQHDNFGNIGFKREHIGEIPVIAYSIKKRMDISALGLDGSKELEKILSDAQISNDLQKKITNAITNVFDGLTDEISALFVEEEDSIVCTKCAWNEYDFQIALGLCKTSAHRRRQAEFEEQKKLAEATQP
jgi:hypothetical protein